MNGSGPEANERCEKAGKKAPASCAGARVVGSPEVDRVENDESTPITSCGRVSLRVSCTQGARETHVRVVKTAASPRAQVAQLADVVVFFVVVLNDQGSTTT